MRSQVIGSNRRYPDHAAKLMDERIMAERHPESLREVEKQLDVEPLTKSPVPRPVRAWVRYGDRAIRVDAEAVAWTAYAVAIQWVTPTGDQHRAWVWASAVRDR